MPKITVPQKNMTIEVETGVNLMDTLIENQIPVASSCLGEGVCSKCAVVCQPVLNHSELEIQTLKKNNLDLTHRLSCQLHVSEDISVSTRYW